MVLIVLVIHTHWQPGRHQQDTYVGEKQKAEHKKELWEPPTVEIIHCQDTAS
jgi:hypothetical protein